MRTFLHNLEVSGLIRKHRAKLGKISIQLGSFRAMCVRYLRIAVAPRDSTEVPLPAQRPVKMLGSGALGGSSQSVF